MPLKILHIFLILAFLTTCSEQAVKEEKHTTVIPKRAEPLVCIAAKPVPCDCRCDEKKVVEETVKSTVETPPAKEAITEEKTSPTDFSLLKPTTWQKIDGFNQAYLSQAWPAWQQSCQALIKKSAWSNVCKKANQLQNQFADTPPEPSIRAYFQTNFNVFQTTNTDGSTSGLITGYYEPSLKGSRTQSSTYAYPLYQEPNDLITVALDDLFPELRHKRVRGRIVDNQLVPYYTRAEIETDSSPIKEKAFVYINDIIDVFFLHIQGSGLIQLDNGEQLHVGYANHNGFPYQSIGKKLIQDGELKASQASMQGIKNWARTHPDKLRDLLNSNPSFVFFRELPTDLPGPLGALGVPLLAEQAVAVDKKYVPLGAPVFLSTTAPNNTQTIKKLMMAQDTGGAIKGGVRADFYWGSGDAAGKKAGAMKQKGQLWVFLPKDYPLPQH